MENSKKKFIITIIAVLLLNAGFIYGGWWFYQKGIISPVNETADQLAELSKLEAQRKALGIMSSSVKETENTFKQIKGAFLSEEESVDFIKTLQGVARRNNLGISITSVNPVQTEDQSYSATFRFVLTGQYNNVLTYMTMLEKSEFLIRFDGININAQGTEGIVTASVTITSIGI